MAIKDVFHVNVNCTSLEKSRAFYEKVGFKAVVELGLGGGRDMLRGLGLPEDSQAKAVLMMLEPDKPRGYADRSHRVGHAAHQGLHRSRSDLRRRGTHRAVDDRHRRRVRAAQEGGRRVPVRAGGHAGWHPFLLLQGPRRHDPGADRLQRRQADGRLRLRRDLAPQWSVASPAPDHGPRGGDPLSGGPDSPPIESTGGNTMSDFKTLIDGLSFTECPRWRDGRLYLSDFYTHRVLAGRRTARPRRSPRSRTSPRASGSCPTAGC